MPENTAVNVLLASQVALDLAKVNQAAVGQNAAVLASVPREYIVSTLTLTNLTVAAVDTAGVIARISKKLLSFPKGYLDIQSTVVRLAVTKSSAGVISTFAGKVSVGTVACAGDATLTATEADIVASTTTAAATAGVGAANAAAVAAVTLDGMATAKDLYLNYLINDADHDVTTTPCNLIFNGTITVTWRNMG